MITPESLRPAFGGVLAVVAMGVGSVHAGFDVRPYLGSSSTRSTDVRLERPGDDLVFRDVAWEGRSFEEPLYYGLRLAYWLERHPGWGLALDFTHAKMHAKLDDVVGVSGIRDGQVIVEEERLNDTFDELSFSHGHNLLLLNGQHRWMSDPAHGVIRARFRPYVGLGLGVAIPHVEILLGGTLTNEYQRAGPAAQGLAGLDIGLSSHVSIFLEYKLSYAHIEADLQGGGTLEVEPWTNHFVVGTSLGF